MIITRLEKTVGIRGIALEWFRSFLSNKTFSVNISQSYSKSAPLNCGVPQGSILGQISFLLYMLPFGSIFQSHELSFHCFADNTQVYLPLRKQNKRTITSLLNCLHEVKLWMSANF